MADVLLADLDDLVADLTAGSQTASSLAMLRRDLRLAVRSFLGFTLTFTVPGPQVSVAINIVDGTLHPHSTGDVVAVQLPTHGTGSSASVTVYAERPHDLDDLRTELAEALECPQSILTHTPIRRPVIPGIDGLSPFVKANRAIGFLIGLGHTPESAGVELIRRAHTDPDGINGAARTVLDQATADRPQPDPTRPDRRQYHPPSG